jgi:hypothetical protein
VYPKVRSALSTAEEQSDEGRAPYPWWVIVSDYCPNITSLDKTSTCHESFMLYMHHTSYSLNGLKTIFKFSTEWFVWCTTNML